MAVRPVNAACAYAWRTYMLLHSGVSEEDERRSALHRFLSDLYLSREYDFKLLQVAAVTYLRALDEVHEERAARQAANKAVESRIERESKS
jgi:hypothetical protein